MASLTAKSLLASSLLAFSILQLSTCFIIKEWNGKAVPVRETFESQPREFICPADGFYPVSGQCTSEYYACTEGVANLQSCSVDYIFDPVTFKCTASEEASCNQKYDCAGKDGVFAYPDGCAQFYYVCNAGVSYIQFCPENYVFDPVTKKCATVDEASCNFFITETTTVETTTEFTTTEPPLMITEVSTEEPTTDAEIN